MSNCWLRGKRIFFRAAEDRAALPAVLMLPGSTDVAYQRFGYHHRIAIGGPGGD